MMKKALAELIGTFVLVFFGCGSAVFAGDQAGMLPLGIAFAFGLAIVAMAYGIGPVSGCHVNPAVSLGAWIAGRMNTRDLGIYVVAQVIGAILGAAALYVILSGQIGAGPVTGLGQNGWGEGYQGGYGVGAAFLFEVLATFIFLVVILGSTHKLAPTGFAGLAIGLTLTAIHIVGIRITGVSVNPARSLGPALLIGGQALSQLWLFIVAPFIGAALAGLLFRLGILEGKA
nr:aquaporin Z [Asticcacaulis benevestitus]